MNIFTLQFLFFSYKLEMSMSYFIDYSLTESWNEFMKPHNRDKIKADTYKFEPVTDPSRGTNYWALANDKFKQCSQLVLDYKFGKEQNFVPLEDPNLEYRGPRLMYHDEDWNSQEWYEGQWNKEKNEPEGVGINIKVGFSFCHFWREIGVFEPHFKLVEGWRYEQANKTYIN